MAQTWQFQPLATSVHDRGRDNIIFSATGEMNMRRFILTGAVLALIGSNASAAMVERKIGYEVSGKAFEGVLIYDDGVTAKRPAILMEPGWSGVSPVPAGTM
jgi:hypothetical protein